MGATPAAGPTRLRLTRLGPGDAPATPIVLRSNGAVADAMYAANFSTEAVTTPGTYSVEVSNGFGGAEEWVRLASFLGPGGKANASSSVLEVKRPRRWTNGKPEVFDVSEFGCAGTIECDSTAAVAAALAAADANGGGVVHLPRGQYYLMTTDDGIQLGPGVALPPPFVHDRPS